MAEAETGRLELALGDGLFVRVVDIHDLREQEINAHYMPARVFERLVDNIKRRGALESLPYVHRPGDEGLMLIISGHHRVRAARAAGLATIPVLVDTNAMSRSQVTAKQLAHNALIGMDDVDLLRQLIDRIDDPDDLLMTGLDPSLLPSPDHEAMLLFTPTLDFEWRSVALLFLPHQVADLVRLCESLQGQQDEVLLIPAEQFQAFISAAVQFSRIRNIRHGGAVVATLTKIALQEIAKHDAAPATVPDPATS